MPRYVSLELSEDLFNTRPLAGDASTIHCPTGYTFAVRTNLYGVTASGQCELHNPAQHCLETSVSIVVCGQSCIFVFRGDLPIASCNSRPATYQYVEYQCIPKEAALVSPNTTCAMNSSKTPVLIDKVGRFQSYGYPTLMKMNCTYRLIAKPNHIMHIYARRIVLHDYSVTCGTNKMTLLEDGDTEGTTFCKIPGARWIYSSHSNEIELRYTVTDIDNTRLSFGAELYIESEAHPATTTSRVPTSQSK